ncbi:hypothetical protein PFISCL1PPCAC_28743, partial [Pristionchus fissidentatus]
VDNTAKVCRDSIKSTLSITQNLTRDSRFASHFLLNRMNALLGGVVETNFGASGPLASTNLRSLYDAIESTQSAFMNDADNLSLFYFARSFAVVIEEAMKKQNERNDPWARPDASWTNLHEEEASRVPLTPPSAPHYQHQPPQLLGFGRPQNSSMTSSFGGGNAREKTWERSDTARKNWTKKSSNTELDTSPEAIMGRITVYRIPTTTKPEEVRAFLEPIGTILDLSYPRAWDGEPRGFALAKFESNEKADEAVARLDRQTLGGGCVYVGRAKHWFRNAARGAARVRNDDATDADPPHFGCGLSRTSSPMTKDLIDSQDESPADSEGEEEEEEEGEEEEEKGGERRHSNTDEEEEEGDEERGGGRGTE